MHLLYIILIISAVALCAAVILARRGAYPFTEFMNSYNEIHAFVFGFARVFGLLDFSEMSVLEYKASIEDEHAYYVGGKLTGRALQVLPGILLALYELGILKAWGLM